MSWKWDKGENKQTNKKKRMQSYHFTMLHSLNEHVGLYLFVFLVMLNEEIRVGSKIIGHSEDSKHIFFSLTFNELTDKMGLSVCINWQGLVWAMHPCTLQSTLIISKSKGLYEIVRDIRTSTYQICRIEEKVIQTTTFQEWISNFTPEVTDILKIL